jgi:hypothetical protein
MKQMLMVLVAAIVSLSCSDSGTTPAERSFNVSLKFGVGARNELNTFTDTFTKDLILDGTVTTKLVLPQAEIDSLEARFLRIDIFTYPDTFMAQQTDTVAVLTPHTSYVLKLSCEHREKAIYWEDSIISTDPRAAELRNVFAFVRALVEAKPEYQGLPPARGGYL